MKKNKKIMAEGIQDPYAGSIDEFLLEKKGADPQDSAVDELEDETGREHQEPDIDTPQEQLEDKVDDTSEDRAEDNLEDLEKQKQELQNKIENLQSEKEVAVESRLRKLAAQIESRGYPSLASLFLKAAGGVPGVLNDLLVREYQILDIIGNYLYLVSDLPLDEHIQHDPKEAIKYLQKQIISLGGTPTAQRLTIPKIKSPTTPGILALIQEYEKCLIQEYTKVIKQIEDDPELAVLKLNLGTIIKAKSEKI
jgi:hypothetical protein